MDETSTVSIYSCGPTLNDYIHIGAYRNFVLADILKKHFGVKGYYCKHGMNIMDARKHFAFNVIFYCNQFKTEYELMNLELPNIITFTTQNTTEILSIVDDLLNRKVAYTTTEGTFVDISKIDGYGELTGISAKGNFCFNDTSLNKRNTSDFAIWKFDKDDSRGYPGWDIQCAANCIIHLNNSLDYIIVGFNELVHTENINTLINLYPRKVTNTKWIRIHYVDFQDDVPLFYLKDFIDKGFSRQLIKYMLYITNYNSEIKLSSKYINDCKKTMRK